jgi:hypothetical protein
MVKIYRESPPPKKKNVGPSNLGEKFKGGKRGEEVEEKKKI